MPLRLALAALMTAAGLAAAQAQTYPTVPIRIISGFPAGTPQTSRPA